jgi:hypothetical protein
MQMGKIKMQVADQGNNKTRANTDDPLEGESKPTRKQRARLGGAAAWEPSRPLSGNEKREGIHWAKVVALNFRYSIIATYFGVGGEYLQNYLNEACFKFNRRISLDRIFDQLLVASLVHWRNE